jgi:hypothetical protein
MSWKSSAGKNARRCRRRYFFRRSHKCGYSRLYETLRTWRERAKEIIKWAENGGLEAKLSSYEKDIGYRHFGRMVRAEQIRRVLKEPAKVDRMKTDLRRTHMLFAKIEAVRVALAKHEVRGRAKAAALMPGYGRINEWCGSVEYEMANEAYSMGTLSRRDIADGIRAFAANKEAPSEAEIEEFETFMRGPPSPPDFGGRPASKGAQDDTAHRPVGDYQTDDC